MVIDNTVDLAIRDICLKMQKRYELHFVEIGTDRDHVHFLVQSVPIYSVTKLVTMIKSITARRLLESMPELKKKMWGAHLWTSGYYVSTVGKQGNENTISKYVKEQGRADEYEQLHKDQLSLFL
jgi:REP element-mobilizing transposase RayT